MSLLKYPDISKYVWAYKNRLEIHVDSYMCNKNIKVMYLGFLYNVPEREVYKIISLFK